MNTRSRILIVDDAPENVMALEQALDAIYDIQTANSGEEALRLIDRSPPDLVLLDVLMPGLSGIEVVRILREREQTRELPVILFSADNSERVQMEGLDAGADDFLTKPVITAILQIRVRNILLRKQTETRLRLAAHVFEHSGEAIMVTDRKNHIVEVNPAFTRLTGYSPEEVLGKNPSILSSGHYSPEFYQTMWADIQENGFWQGEMWDRTKGGSVYPKLLTITTVRNQYDEIDYHIANFTNISEQKTAEARIQHLAYHDSLTGLPNRLQLMVGMEHALALAHREGRKLALMMIDLDRFKSINDTLGHLVGDMLLAEVAKRLTGCVRESDMVARLGGDEFVVMLEGADACAASHLAGKILGALSAPYEIASHVLRSTASIGISLYPNDSDRCEGMLKNADLALYEAKSKGRNNYQFFRDQQNHAMRERLMIESRMYEALDRQHFQLHYQPQINPSNGVMVGVEALLRWNDTVLGEIKPDHFIPIAEESGLILPLGSWVMDTACKQLRDWKNQGFLGLRMAVNLSLYQLRQENIALQVKEILTRHDLEGADLEIEITESAAMQNPEATIRTLKELRKLGVSLAVDDFGTGYSSLAYLKLLPIQRIKLDRGFVQDIESDSNDAAICSATIAIASAMGLEVVAEGVETNAQRNFLEKLGCDIMQGFLFGTPMPADLLSGLDGSPMALTVN